MSIPQNTQLSRLSDKQWKADKYRKERLHAVTTASAKGKSGKNTAKNHYYCCTEVHTNQEKDIKYANTCKWRWCPVCNWRKSRKTYGRVYNAIRWINSQEQKYRYIFITLTIRNCEYENLAETVLKLNDGWRKFTRKKAIQDINKGYIKSIEITTNKRDRTVHPHIHAIIAVKPSYFSGRQYISKKKLKDIWAKCMNIEYAPQVDIRACTETESAIAEISKYAVKNADIKDEEELITLIEQLYRKRMLTYAGIIREGLLATGGELKEEDSKEPCTHDEHYVWNGQTYIQEDNE